MRPPALVNAPPRPRALPEPASPPALAPVLGSLLDRAHDELAVRPLADLLLALRDPAERLALDLPAPFAVAERGALGLPQGLRARLRAALRILRLAVEDGSARPLGAWLAGYLEEVAARPRGAAVPRARPGR